MPKIWNIKPNIPDIWTFENVEIIAGKRSINDWINNMKKSNFIKCIQISENDDGCDFLNKLSTNINATSESYANTVKIYEHPSYTIECTYRSDLNFQNSTDFNYFGTVVNIESVNMFGSAVFFKTFNKKLINLEIDELLSLIINFYFLKTYKLTNGTFEEIGMINYEPEISRILNGYKVRKFNNWLVFSDDPKSNLDKLEKSGNNINEFNNLIWLKIKQHIGDIYEAIETLNLEKNKDGDMRGIYMDLDIDFIKTVFFSL
jgi:hypothetical protein